MAAKGRKTPSRSGGAGPLNPQRKKKKSGEYNLGVQGEGGLRDPQLFKGGSSGITLLKNTEKQKKN